MLFDPDDGRSIEEIIQRTWDHEWPEPFKARVRALAEAQGCQWFDLVMRRMEGVLAQLEDPAECARVMARWHAQALPFGPDPTHRGPRG